MTNLERLIARHAPAAALTTIAQATERIAEEMAREILRDPAFRTEMQTLIRAHFSATMSALATNGKRKLRRKRARRTKP